VELRALMSAPERTLTWGLRCNVREKLLEFVQENIALLRKRSAFLRIEQNQNCELLEYTEFSYFVVEPIVFCVLS
jgi:hypothetical protein